MTFRQLEISLRQPFTRARVFRMNIYIYIHVCMAACIRAKRRHMRKERKCSSGMGHEKSIRSDLFFSFFLTTDLTELI